MPETKTLTPAMEKELRGFTESLEPGMSGEGVSEVTTVLYEYIPAALATIDQLRDRVLELESGMKEISDIADIRRAPYIASRYLHALNPKKEARHEIKAKPEYNAVIGQLICPHCGMDCGGFCEPGDRRYEDDV